LTVVGSHLCNCDVAPSRQITCSEALCESGSSSCKTTQHAWCGAQCTFSQSCMASSALTKASASPYRLKRCEDRSGWKLPYGIPVALLNIESEFRGRNTWKLQGDLECFPLTFSSQVVLYYQGYDARLASTSTIARKILNLWKRKHPSCFSVPVIPTTSVHMVWGSFSPTLPSYTQFLTSIKQTKISIMMRQTYQKFDVKFSLFITRANITLSENGVR
jgi:hypothetical protein